MTADTVIAKLAGFFRDDPFARGLGIELIELAPGYAKTRMELKPAHLNFNGFIHGGALFSLMDYAFSAASNSHNQSAVAVAMSVQYVNAPERSGFLYGEAREIEKSRKLGLYDLTVRDESGRLICKSDARVYRIGKPIVEEE